GPGRLPPADRVQPARQARHRRARRHPLHGDRPEHARGDAVRDGVAGDGMRRGRLRIALFLLVAVGSILLVTALYFAPTWKPVRSAFESTADLERKSIDARFRIRGPQAPPADIAVVGIDDDTFQDLQKRFPFRRIYHANVINRLHRDGAKLIVVDIQFTEPTDAVDDNALITACRDAR